MWTESPNRQFLPNQQALDDYLLELEDLLQWFDEEA